MASLDVLRLNNNSNPVSARAARITAVVLTATRDKAGAIILVTFKGRTGLVVSEAKVITSAGSSSRDLEQVAKFFADQGWRRRGQATRSEVSLTCASEESAQPEAS